MKLFCIKAIFLFGCLSSISLHSQTFQRPSKIYEQIDRENLLNLRDRLQKELNEREQRIQAYLNNNPHVKKIIKKKILIKEIYDVLNNKKILYLETSNFNSS